MNANSKIKKYPITKRFDPSIKFIPFIIIKTQKVVNKTATK